MERPEPWLRGPVPDVHPLIGAVFHSFEQAREDLARHAGGLAIEQVWAHPRGLTPVGFHLRHIAGSIDRLTTYLAGRQLEPKQLEEMELEKKPGESVEGLLDRLAAATHDSERIVASISPVAFDEKRAVGRKQLPTTVAGLLVHLAEHTQRHVGQAIVTARLVRSMALE